MTKPRGIRSEEAKAATSAAMIQHRAIRGYLTALQTQPKRKVKSSEDLAKELANATDPIERLKLRPQLREALEMESRSIVVAEANFVEHAKAFSDRFGITYGDWREEGVPASVLKDAGIKVTYS